MQKRDPRPEGLYLKFSDYGIGAGIDQNTPVIIERVNGDCSVSEFIIARDEAYKLREALAAALPAPPYVQDFNAQRGRGIYVVTGEHQRTAFFDKEAAEKYLAHQDHERFKIVEYSKPAPQFGPGDYSCAVCGLGMVEPCEHWKEAAEVKDLIRRGHASAERVRQLHGLVETLANSYKGVLHVAEEMRRYAIEASTKR